MSADAPTLAARFARTRAATLALAAPLSPEDCQVQAAPFASPVKWHLAHTTWFFEVFLLEENQSTYIPIGAKHRIENPGKIPLHLIEVQSGSYLGEDDIVRFEDNYGRR